MVVFCKENIC